MYRGPVIDCDIHHDWASPAELLPYLSEGWREYVVAPGRKAYYGSNAGTPMMPIAAPLVWPSPVNLVRAEAWPEDGSAPGSDYELMREQLLDPFRVERGVLGYGSGSFVGALPNPHYAIELARAANDWCVDRWLSGLDDRLYGSVLLATQVPEAAAQEIRRIGTHPRMAQALLVSNSLGKPFGHPIFHPIYEAACEVGIPVALHAAGQAVGGTEVAHIGGGQPSFYLESHVLNLQGCMTNIVSFITHGVFERFPDLKLLVIEGGTAWIPGLLWRLDADFKGVRKEVSWLKRHPSEYFHDHVRLTSQPLESPPDRDSLIDVLRAFGAEDILCFASDYPHWDTDEVEYVASRLPREWHRKVFYENAHELYGFQAGAAPAPQRVASQPA